jgi:anti-sigma regulatory factor (Ser/Thr protein kinase)
MEPAAAPAPVSDEGSTDTLRRPTRPQEWQRCFPIRPDAVRLARLHARTRFTLMSWPGDQEDATSMVVELMTNAVEHVGPEHDAGEIVLDLAVTKDETLLIAVTDPSPAFPDFFQAISAQKSTGLARVRELGGVTTWWSSEDRNKKTVQVRITRRRALTVDYP